ncbi:MAG TPA: hypothetical protein VFG12_10730 [Rhodopila sp.]|jgi:hypothetical protein|nr:hypothetical protein [Rhodopila sp.]
MAFVACINTFDQDGARHRRAIGIGRMVAADTLFAPASGAPDRPGGGGLVTYRPRLVASIAAGASGHARRHAEQIADRGTGATPADVPGQRRYGWRLMFLAMAWVAAARQGARPQAAPRWARHAMDVRLP